MSGAVARVLKPLGGDVSLTAQLNKTGAVSQFRVCVLVASHTLANSKYSCISPDSPGTKWDGLEFLVHFLVASPPFI